MKRNKGSIIKDIMEEINKYNDDIKNGTATEDMSTVLERACKKAGIKINNKEIKEKAKELNGNAKDTLNVNEFLKMLDEKLDELDDTNEQLL